MTAPRQDPPAKRPVGRRGGDSDTRSAILDAALDMFAEQGFEKASMRAIASRAGVDSAMIRHFFGNKATLFVTTMADRTVIPERMGAALTGPPESLGIRLADAYLRLWEADDTRPILLGLVRSAMTSSQGAALLLEVIGGRIQEIAPFPAGADGRMRGFAFAATHLFGVAVGRHILQLPMLAGMSREEIVEAVGPTIQRYLTES